jgi:hypothetical protein
MEETTGGQFINQAAIDSRLGGVIEVCESFVLRKVSKLQVEFDGAAITFLKFRFQQVAEEMRVGPTGSGCLLRSRIELGQGCN